MALRLLHNPLRSGASRSQARLHDLELSPIKAVELQASRIPGVVSLAQGIPSFDTPEPIKRFVQQMMAEGACAKYSLTPGLPRLREAIAEALRQDGMQYDPENEIIATAGSIEAIAATLLASVNPGDEVLVVSPTYASYLPAIQIAGGEPRFVPLNEDANFDLDPEAIDRLATRRTRALLICNPNNPTGTVFSRQQTQRMLEVAERHDLLVITDEVYKDFVYGDAQIYSAAMDPRARGRVIRVFSFSKAYAMTGWRIGFVHGPAERISGILAVHDALVTCAPVVSQYAALAALELGHEAVDAFRAEFRQRRDRVINRLDALSHVFDYQKPNASYFAFPRVKDVVPHARDSRRLASEILERAHVALVPGVAFGPTGEAHLRFCYARPADDVERAFDRLEDYFAGRPVRTLVDVPVRAREARPPGRQPLQRAGIALLRNLARAYVRRKQPRVVAVTGSIGKTVIKRTLQELLAPHLRVRANPLSYNTEVGVALAVLGCDLDTSRPPSIARGFRHALWSAYGDPAPLDVLLLELGIRRAGDMQAHLDLLQPDIAIVTGLQPNTSGDQDEIAVLRAEISALCSAPKVGQFLLCADDPAVAELAARTPGALLFGDKDLGERDGQLFVQVGETRFETKRDAVGRSSRYALVVAVHVGRALGLTDEQIASFLAG
jgi:aminotransferase